MRNSKQIPSPIRININTWSKDQGIVVLDTASKNKKETNTCFHLSMRGGNKYNQVLGR